MTEQIVERDGSGNPSVYLGKGKQFAMTGKFRFHQTNLLALAEVALVRTGWDGNISFILMEAAFSLSECSQAPPDGGVGLL